MAGGFVFAYEAGRSRALDSAGVGGGESQPASVTEDTAGDSAPLAAVDQQAQTSRELVAGNRLRGLSGDERLDIEPQSVAAEPAVPVPEFQEGREPARVVASNTSVDSNTVGGSNTFGEPTLEGTEQSSVGISSAVGDLSDPTPEQALGSVRSVAQRSLPAVVSLDVLRDNDGGGDLAAASGFVWGDGGLIVTASHVVDDALVVVAQFEDGARYPMSVVGRDVKTDLAVLRFDERPDELFVLPTVERSGLFAGDWVVTIGGPLGLDHSVSAALVSHTERRLRTEDGRGTEVYLQLTGLVHPGSSGGPVLDLSGRVVGVTTRKMNGAEGISFALPIETVTAVVDRLLHDEDRSIRYDLGATLYEHRPSGAPRPIPAGAVPEGGVAVSVVDVESGRAADRAGLRSGDVLVTVNQEPIRSLRDLEDGLTYGESGAQVEFGVVRLDSESETVEVELLPVPTAADPSMDP
ncbi:MAG: S1C family serine protease [Planctomycetota bacterium]